MKGGISPVAPRLPKETLQSLPPILRIIEPSPTTGYSKAPRGLFVLVRVGCIFTANSISPSLSLRQRPTRYAIRAGRNLPDKEFRYLRTVIGTAAVHRGFGSGLAALPLTFRHWAGVSPYTSTYVLAETCVFDKQSLVLIYCDLQGREPPEVPLIPKLRGHIAEFLNHRSPERLRLLVSPTCVSFSTVTNPSTLRRFSWTCFR